MTLYSPESISNKENWTSNDIISAIFGVENNVDNHKPLLHDIELECIYNRFKAAYSQEASGESLPAHNAREVAQNAPAPAKALHAFVTIICTKFDGGDKTPAGDAHHRQVVSDVLERMEKSPALRAKLTQLREYAAKVEGELEKASCTKIMGNMDALADISAFKVDMNVTDKDALAAQRRQKLSQFVVTLSSMNPQEGYILDRYERSTSADIRMREKTLEPLLFDRTLENATDSRLLEAKASQVRANAKQLMHTLTGRDSITRHMPVKENSSITFVGSGSLPLTGLMLHIASGAEINLVDIDPEAVKISRKFIAKLESLHIVTPGKIHVISGNALDMRYEPSLPQPMPVTYSAKEVSDGIQKDSASRFLEKRSAHLHKQLMQPISAALDDKARYVPQYRLAHTGASPFAISFSGYKTNLSEDGRPYQTVHEILFDAKRGWQKSEEKRIVPTDTLFVAILIPEKARDRIVGDVLKQVNPPPALMLRSVEGLAKLFYCPAQPNQVADARMPFLGSIGNTSAGEPTLDLDTGLYAPSLTALLPSSARGNHESLAARMDEMAENLSKADKKVQAIKKLPSEKIDWIKRTLDGAENKPSRPQPGL